MKRKIKGPGFQLGEFHVPEIPDYVIAELRYDSSVAIERSGRLVAPQSTEANANQINQLLSSFTLKRVSPHFELPEIKTGIPNQRHYSP